MAVCGWTSWAKCSPAHHAAGGAGKAADDLFRIAKLAPGGAKEIIKNILKQMGSEGSQEVISELAGNLADSAIMGDNSAYERYVQSLMAQGADEKTARAAATKQFYVDNVAKAGLGGALSGGVMAGGASAVGAARSAGSANTETGSVNEPNFGQKNTASMIETTSAPQRAGHATVIQAPYNGEKPGYSAPARRMVPSVSSDAVLVAGEQIAIATKKSEIEGKSPKNFLTDFYERMFKDEGGAHGVAIDGASFGEKPYIVTVSNNSIGKVISDKNLSAEKLAIFNVLDDVIENGEYVGSGKYVQKGKSRKETIRFDYFETPVKINGQDYIVTFDTEVFPSTNNYRTHKVINEMDLVPADQTDTGTDQSPGRTGQSPFTTPNVAQAAPEVNTQDMQNGANDAPTAPKDEVHIDNRTWTDASNRKVKAFQYDHPELHQFFVEAANQMSTDLANTTKGERFPIKDADGDFIRYTGTKRTTSSAVAAALDDANLSYAQISKALDDLIADHGQENYAAAKKVELVLDTMLSEGYADAEGRNYGGNEDYVSAKNRLLQGKSDEDHEYRMSEEEWASLLSEERLPPADGLGAANHGFDPWSHFQNQKDSFHPDGEEPRARQVDVPTTDMDGRNISKSAATVMEAGVIPDEMVSEVQKMILDGKFSYSKNTDTGATSRAERTISDKGWGGAMEHFHGEAQRGVVSKDLMALGATLLNNAAQNRDGGAIVRILTDYSAMSRAGAQATQANRLLKKLSPQGQLYAVTRSVEA